MNLITSIMLSTVLMECGPSLMLSIRHSKVNKEFFFIVTPNARVPITHLNIILCRIKR